MKAKLSPLSRLFLLISAVGLVIVLFVPLWRIDLVAPQYPEGLKLLIHTNDLKGNVDIINGLNHYIGMKTLHKADFIEFTILPYIIIGFSILFALVALLNRRGWLNLAFGLFVIFGIVAMVDFWRWEYDYGHNLDPNAAIIVPGMAYQPPLIGFKQLLNFGAFSVPDIGGIIFITVGLLLLIAVYFEWKKHKALKLKMKTGVVAMLAAMMLLLGSCSSKPDPIKPGTDACSFCKMTISDIRFGAEAITKKGKIFKFDDIHCMLAFLESDNIKRVGIGKIYLTDFSQPHGLVNAESSFLLQGSEIKGPMNGDIVSFSNKDSLQKTSIQFKGTEKNWADVLQ